MPASFSALLYAGDIFVVLSSSSIST